jgi:hypothetical protein
MITKLILNIPYFVGGWVIGDMIVHGGKYAYNHFNSE